MQDSNYKIINIYTDGACSGNPGEGGAAAILKYKEHEKTISAYFPYTTNNQMELLAAIIGLEAVKFSNEINLYTDSNYVKNGITNWIFSWVKNNWKTSNNKPVKNIELWQKLHSLNQKLNIKWHWVKGHSGHKENEQADLAARLAIKNKSPIISELNTYIKN